MAGFLKEPSAVLFACARAWKWPRADEYEFLQRVVRTSRSVRSAAEIASTPGKLRCHKELTRLSHRHHTPCCGKLSNFEFQPLDGAHRKSYKLNECSDLDRIAQRLGQ